MIFVYQIILIAVNMLMAAYHARLIKKEKRIKHGLWGAAYVILAAGMALSINPCTLFVHSCTLSVHSWTLFVLSLFIRKVVFDISLNMFLFRPMFFVSTETGSILDDMHYFVFGKKSEYYMILYTLIVLIINIKLII